MFHVSYWPSSVINLSYTFWDVSDITCSPRNPCSEAPRHLSQFPPNYYIGLVTHRGSLKVLSHAPTCSEIFHNCSHGMPLQVISDSRYSQSGAECPPTVWFSPEIDASKLAIHIPSDTPGVCRWKRFRLWMLRAIGGVPENDDRVNSVMNLQAGIMQPSRCTWRPGQSECSHRHVRGDGGSFQIALEAVNERVWRHLEAIIVWLWQPVSVQSIDTLGCCDLVDLDMHSEVILKRVLRCIWKISSSIMRGVLGGSHWEAVDGRHSGYWDSIQLLFNSQLWECDKVMS